MNNGLKKKESSDRQTRKSRLPGKGLSRSMLLWFLFLSLVPLSIVAVVSYRNARESLHQDSRDALITDADFTTQRVQYFFDRMLLDLKQESEEKANVRFLMDLIDAFKKSRRPIAEFTKGYQWALLTDKNGGDLRTFCQTYGYKDVLLTDANGNILFTVGNREDLGNNLFAGPLAETRLAHAARRSLETGQPVFSDYERYAPMNNEVSGFLVSILVDDFGEKVGLIILNFDSFHTDSILQRRFGEKTTQRTYLIGIDQRLRSRWDVKNPKTVLTMKIDTEQAERWRKEHEKRHERGHESSHEEMHDTITYTGPMGAEVLGGHRDLQIATTRWAVIAEIETAEAFASANQLRRIVLGMLLGTILLILLIALPLVRRTFTPLQALSSASRRIAAGDLDHSISVSSRNEIGELADNFNQMVDSLKAATRETELENWMKNGRAELNEKMRGDLRVEELGKKIITFLCKYLNARVGAIYAADEDETLNLVGSFAFQKRKGMSNVFKPGEGLAGQAALEREMIQVNNLPADYFAIGSGLGETRPRSIVVAPLIYGGAVEGVAEFGFLSDPDQRSLDFLNQVGESVALAFRVAFNRKEMQVLLKQTQKQAEELQVREEELRENNTLLEKQSRDLKVSEERLMKQQVELEEKNEALENQQKELAEANEQLQETASELEQQTAELEMQKTEIEEKNRELEKTRKDMEKKADALEISGKYKSEFLANMSHELRTPLNSLLILSKLLSNNEGGNLTDKQVEFARTIYDSGNDLLRLINDILDLSKIEAGRMTVETETVDLKQFVENVRKTFDPLAKKNNLVFRSEIGPLEKTKITTDSQKLHQIVSNLLSNAIKFTSEGSVTLSIGPSNGNLEFDQSRLSEDNAVCFQVIDTGVGIDADKQRLIFEAFQQEDGSTSRKYGGTGLGLSISRELARVLGGEIHLESRKGEGSIFSLVLPVNTAPGNETVIPPRQEVSEKKPKKGILPADGDSAVSRPTSVGDTAPLPECEDVRDDRRNIRAEDRSLLIVEDDARFSRVLRDFARERGFKCLIADDGETGLHFAEYYEPSGIILDIGLPGIDGWEVMGRLKENAKTRHIPVHFISASDREFDALMRGAVGYLTKPVDLDDMEAAFGRIEDIIEKETRDLLIVEDDNAQAESIRELVGNGDVFSTIAATGKEAISLLAEKQFDCIVLDLGLPDMEGKDFLERLRKMNGQKHIPVIVYTGKEIGDEEHAVLTRYADSILVKGARSPERLLDETALFLHRVEERLPEEKRRMIRMLHDQESVLREKTVLIVDDDMRNVYALSQILQEKGLTVLVGKDGRQGVNKLLEHPETRLVLMDIMMPGMDGYQAMREIRTHEQFRDLPIIALTAKAMKGDRAKCLAAGASDYLAKPVNPSKLLSMMRVWMYK